MVVEKAINMANMMHVNILGLIENMSYVECPDCGRKIQVFGPSHIQEVADKYGLEVLAQIPLREDNALYSDRGEIEDLKVPEISRAADLIEKR